MTELLIWRTAANHGGKLLFQKCILLHAGLAQSLAGFLGLGRVDAGQRRRVLRLLGAPAHKRLQTAPCKPGGGWAGLRFTSCPCLENEGAVSSRNGISVMGCKIPGAVTPP